MNNSTNNPQPEPPTTNDADYRLIAMTLMEVILTHLEPEGTTPEISTLIARTLKYLHTQQGDLRLLCYERDIPFPRTLEAYLNRMKGEKRGEA